MSDCLASCVCHISLKVKDSFMKQTLNQSLLLRFFQACLFHPVFYAVLQVAMRARVNSRAHEALATVSRLLRAGMILTILM